MSYPSWFLRLLLGLLIGIAAACKPIPRDEVIDWGPPADPSPVEAVVSVDWVGDILLGDFAQGPIDTHGWDWPLAGVKPMLRSDVVVGNAEGPITDRTDKYFPTRSGVTTPAPPRRLPCVGRVSTCSAWRTTTCWTAALQASLTLCGCSGRWGSRRSASGGTSRRPRCP